MEVSVKQRLIQFIKYKGIGQGKFEKTVGLSNGYINQLRHSPSPQKIQMIIGAYPDLNQSWLLTGEGEMLNSVKIDSEPQINFTKGIPYYNVDFIGGFDIVLNDQTISPEYLIDFRKYNEATCWCNVTGHSMEPEITHGDIIALKKIEDKSFLPLGEVYAIVTTNGMRTIKRLGPSSDPKCYTLVPTNKSPEYGIQELPKDMIEHIFQVLGCMKRL
jgi:hypothetical protein